MQTLRTFIAVPLMVFMALSTPALAQQRHAVDPATIAGAVDQHVAKQDADRATIRQALDRPEVQSLAKQMGVDLGRANAAVSTLGAADLERTANAARDVNDALAGGASTVVISTTTIIIVLLLLVLLILLLK
jgi:hypothetical protein